MKRKYVDPQGEISMNESDIYVYEEFVDNRKKDNNRKEIDFSRNFLNTIRVELLS